MKKCCSYDIFLNLSKTLSYMKVNFHSLAFYPKKPKNPLAFKLSFMLYPKLPQTTTYVRILTDYGSARILCFFPDFTI